MNKWKIGSAGITFLFIGLCLVLAGSVGLAQGASEGGVLLVAKDQEAVGFDPHKVPALSSIQIYQHLYNGLVDLDNNAEIVPELATSWETPDDTTYVFHLRKGVKFHNGREMTAEDVKYSFERILDPATASIAKSYYNKIQKIETPDKYTVKFILSEPYADFLTNLASVWGAIVAKEVVEKNGDLMKVDGGTGPFKLKEWVPDNYTLLEKNPDYFVKGQPRVDAIKHLVMKDESARVAAIRTGKVHITSLSPEMVPVLRRESGLVVISYPTLNYTYLAFNCRIKPFDDPRVRLAISYAIDRKLLADIVFKGEADLTGPISPAAKKWALPVSEYPSYTQNIAKAKALLAEAGYPNGFKTVIKTANSYNYMIDTAVAVQNQLKAVGISTEITLVEWGQYVDDWKKGNNEMMVGLNGSGTTPDRALHFFFHSTGTANVWGFKNSKYDELVERARVTLDDKKRHNLYAEAQRMLVNELAPNLFLASPYQFYVVTKNVHNFTPSAILGESVFKDVWLDK